MSLLNMGCLYATMAVGEEINRPLKKRERSKEHYDPSSKIGKRRLKNKIAKKARRNK